MPASNQQVQQYVNEYIRPLAELSRELATRFDDAILAIDDVYAALSDTPTWVDSRDDAPPHLLTPSDVLAINAFLHDVRDAAKNHAQYPVVIKACVYPILI